jgi:hypothetical protein
MTIKTTFEKLESVSVITNIQIKVTFCRIGGVIVSVLATGPNVRVFKPSRGDRFLSAIKNRNTPSFGGEVKPSAQVVKFYGMLKNSTKYERDIS